MTVVCGVALGYTDREIAELLALSESTVRSHIRRFSEEVLSPSGIPFRRASIAAWVWAHASCCARAALEETGDEESRGVSASEL